MINNYFIIVDGEQSGPFSHTDLMDQRISPNTLVRSPLFNDWQNAAQLPEFSEHFRSLHIYFPTKDILANFWWRLLAYIIDYIIILIFAVLVGVLFGILLRFLPDISDLGPVENVYSWRIMIALAMLFYNSVFEATELQGSIGKTVCKLRVVNKEGMRISFSNALGRNFGKIISSLICGLGFLNIFWDDKRQAWHDQLAKTYIIRNV